jgi:hypothetical protein
MKRLIKFIEVYFVSCRLLSYRLTFYQEDGLLWSRAYSKQNLRESGKLRQLEEITRLNLGFEKNKGSV